MTRYFDAETGQQIPEDVAADISAMVDIFKAADLLTPEEAEKIAPAALNCPFCGMASLACIWSANGAHVLCMECTATGPTAFSEDQAWRLWSRRSQIGQGASRTMADVLGVPPDTLVGTDAAGNAVTAGMVTVVDA